MAKKKEKEEKELPFDRKKYRDLFKDFTNHFYQHLEDREANMEVLGAISMSFLSIFICSGYSKEELLNGIARDYDALNANWEEFINTDEGTK
jgi:hypothetical protein